MGVTKNAISRLEAVSKQAPSLAALKKCAATVGCELQVKLVPQKQSVEKPFQAYAGNAARPGVRATFMIQHTGELWGWAWTVLTFCIGLALSAYAVTGLWLWWRRR